MSDTVQIKVDRKKLDAFLEGLLKAPSSWSDGVLAQDILDHGYRPAREITVSVTLTEEEARGFGDEWRSARTDYENLYHRAARKLSAACRAALAKEQSQ